MDSRGIVEGKGGTFRIYIVLISIYNMQEFIGYIKSYQVYTIFNEMAVLVSKARLVTWYKRQFEAACVTKLDYDDTNILSSEPGPIVLFV